MSAVGEPVVACQVWPQPDEMSGQGQCGPLVHLFSSPAMPEMVGKPGCIIYILA